MKTYEVQVEVTPQEDGTYLAEVPALQGCWTTLRPRQSLKLAFEDIYEIIDLHLRARQKEGWPLSPSFEEVVKGKAVYKIRIVLPPVRALLGTDASLTKVRGSALGAEESTRSLGLDG